MDDGEGRECGLGELLCPRGVLPALLVGVGDGLEDDVPGLGDADGERDREELRVGDGVRLGESRPGRLVVPLPVLPCLPPPPE